METDFTFHVINYRENSTYSINLITDNKIEIVYIGIPGARYSNLYTLDYESKTLTEGTSSSRAWIYALVRLLLTLIIEALIFFFFGFRKGKSWTLFIIINLVTQGVLNIWLNTFPSVDYYLIFMLALSLKRGVNGSIPPVPSKSQTFRYPTTHCPCCRFELSDQRRACRVSETWLR